MTAKLTDVGGSTGPGDGNVEGNGDVGGGGELEIMGEAAKEAKADRQYTSLRRELRSAVNWTRGICLAMIGGGAALFAVVFLCVLGAQSDATDAYVETTQRLTSIEEKMKAAAEARITVGQLLKSHKEAAESLRKAMDKFDLTVTSFTTTVTEDYNDLKKRLDDLDKDARLLDEHKSEQHAAEIRRLRKFIADSRARMERQRPPDAGM